MSFRKLKAQIYWPTTDRRFGVRIPAGALVVQALNLMSRADVVVSAYSTLSWWGAALTTMNEVRACIHANFYKNLDTKGAFDFLRCLSMRILIIKDLIRYKIHLNS